MNLRDLSCGLRDYICERSDCFTPGQAQAFRTVMARLVEEEKMIADADEATALRVLRDLN
jgi:hypothetical protein